MMTSGDLVGGANNTAPVMAGPIGAPIMSQMPIIPSTALPTTIPTCDYCTRVIENTNSKVQINIQTGP